MADQFKTEDGTLLKNGEPYTGEYLGETFTDGKKLRKKNRRRLTVDMRGGYRRIPRNRG